MRWADIQSAKLYSENNICQALVSLKCHFSRQDNPVHKVWSWSLPLFSRHSWLKAHPNQAKWAQNGKAPKDMLYIERISDIIRSLYVWKSVLLPTVLDIESILTFLKTRTFCKQFRDLFPTTLHFGFEIQNLRGYFCMSSN